MFFSYSSLPTTLVLLSSRFQFFHLFFFFFPVSCCCSSSQNFSFCWSPRRTGQIQHRTKFLPCVGLKISVFLLSSNFVHFLYFVFVFFGALFILVSLCNLYVSVVVGCLKCKPKLDVECLTIEFEHHFTTRVHTSLLA